jgi:hypothetical protein
MARASTVRRTGSQSRFPRAALRPGLMQADREGQVWLCEAVIRSGEIADYYLVRLTRLLGGNPTGDPLVLSPTEYESFSLNRGLHAVLI